MSLYVLETCNASPRSISKLLFFMDLEKYYFESCILYGPLYEVSLKYYICCLGKAVFMAVVVIESTTRPIFNSSSY